MARTLKEIALQLLSRYEEAATELIYEISDRIEADLCLLEERTDFIRQEIETFPYEDEVPHG